MIVLAQMAGRCRSAETDEGPAAPENTTMRGSRSFTDSVCSGGRTERHAAVAKVRRGAGAGDAPDWQSATRLRQGFGVASPKFG